MLKKTSCDPGEKTLHGGGKVKPDDSVDPDTASLEEGRGVKMNRAQPHLR